MIGVGWLLGWIVVGAAMAVVASGYGLTAPAALLIGAAYAFGDSMGRRDADARWLR